MMYQYEKDYYNVLGLSVVGTLGLLSQTGSIIMDGFHTFTPVMIGMNLGILVPSLMNISKKRTIYRIFNDYKNTFEFIEQKLLYDEFISDVAKFFKGMGIEADLRGAFFIKMCMDAGFFSETRDVMFATFKNDYFDRYVDVMGARVATGAFCCRHAASLVTDIINKMGGVACDIAVYRDQDNIRGNEANHLVTGLVHNNRVVLYESSFPMVMMSMGGAMEVKTKGGKIVSKNIDDSTTYIEFSSDFNNEKINRINRKRLDCLGTLQVEGNQDLYGDYMDIFLEYISRRSELEEFYQKELPKIKRLSMLNKQVVPHGEICE